MSYSSTGTYTYSTSDVEAAFRRFKADIFMIADSTQAVTRNKAEEYAHDIEYLAVRGYLASVDVTLLSGGVEVKAVRYTVNESAGGVESSRPGGVLWPRVPNPFLRIVVSYTSTYTNDARSAAEPDLKISWITSTADTSHSGLSSSGSRSYVSNNYGLERRDYGQ